MAVHIYEGGTEGGTDGTEVSVLHFDGGNMATGEEKNVTKIFSLRTDGETIKNVHVIGLILDQSNLITPLQDYGECTIKREGNIKDYVYLEPNSGSFIMLKQIETTNKNIKVTAKVKQKNGISDAKIKLYLIPEINYIEVVENG